MSKSHECKAEEATVGLLCKRCARQQDRRFEHISPGGNRTPYKHPNTLSFWTTELIGRSVVTRGRDRNFTMDLDFDKDEEEE